MIMIAFFLNQRVSPLKQIPDKSTLIMSSIVTLSPMHTNAFLTVHTITFENDIIVLSIALRYFRHFFHFDAISTFTRPK